MLRGNVQIIVQYPEGPDHLRCVPLKGIASIASAQIAVVGGADSGSTADARRLGQSFVATIRRLVAGVRDGVTGCGGLIRDPRSCHARDHPGARKVLVLVGSSQPPDKVPPHWTNLVDHWPSRSTGGAVLAVLPRGTAPAPWLPPSVARLNVCEWTTSIRECVPAVLAAAGVVPDERRVFISYRRLEAPALAEQLFDALSRLRFDVFLDRFQLPPGIDFEARLADELGDKAMVLVLETQGVNAPWTRFEADFARRHRLGLVAVRLPQGTAVRGVGHRRITPDPQTELSGSGAQTALTPIGLDRVVEWIQRQHERNLLRRRKYLRETVVDALLHAGAMPEISGGGEPIRVASATGAPRREYVIRLSPYPPELREFHDADLDRPSPRARSVLVGPAMFREYDRGARFAWLARRARVRAVDEGALLDAARRIARGSL